jgi:diguanylate cyclase (GGDEF)-like protein
MDGKAANSLEQAMNPQDEILSFASEAPTAAVDACHARPWRILVVDDDRDVHDSTVFALRGLKILDRPLEFAHAYSAAETLALLRQEADIAVILLDVVMESDDAGLRIVETIRQELGMADARIILRTGQPGYAPEMEAIRRYEINDYKTKSELTRVKLYTSLTAAIRSYDQLQRLNASRMGLRRILDASNAFITADGLRDFAVGVIMQIAGFMGIEPEGLLCVRSLGGEGAQPRYDVIGAAGKYAYLVNQPLAQLSDAHVQNLIYRCLNQRETLIEECCIALFCPGRSGNDFAAFVDSNRLLADADRDLVELFCSNIGLCGDNIALICRLREAATVDALVGLPNRLAFIEAVDAIRKTDGGDDQVVAVLDIDHFAEINDLLGHRYGDLLIAEVARRLRAQLPAEVTVARVAGDGFGILGAEDIVEPASLRGLFHAPMQIDGIASPLSFSIGLARLREFQAGGAELLKNASIARKRAKTGGQIGRAAYYTPEISEEIRSGAVLLHELRLAQQSSPQPFFLVYQPQVELASGKVVGLEALLRWKKEDGSLVPPDRFVPIAEQSGLIVSLGQWVLRTALAALKRLRDLGHTEICMAVNVSAAQFRDPDFIACVDQCLCDSGVAPEWLELEITESAAIIGLESMQDILRELKTRRLTLAIDDFGTGYSSLSYLDRFPVDRLKIDRSFITLIGTGQPGVRITEMVVPLGRRLGMKVLAEGVENAEQIERLRQLGCDEVQGYYSGRPMRLEALLDWLGQREGSSALRQ